MTSVKPFTRTLLGLVIGSLLAMAASPDVGAQTARQFSEQRHAAKAKKQTGSVEQKYPAATRKPAEDKASAKMATKLEQLVELYQADKAAEARAAADAILAAPAANAYDRSYAAQVAAQVAYTQQDNAAASEYLKQAIAHDGLDNNGHYGAMYMLAQLQFQDQKYGDALATLDKFLGETKSQDPDQLALKGNMLYRLERYPEAVAVLKQAVAASPKARADWLQLLMGSYFAMDQPDEAARIAEQISAANPNDKTLQVNVASVYLQAGQMDKAAAILEKLRAAGQLDEDKDYRNLYAIYLNTEGKEKAAIGVINEGLEKGILKPDYRTYSALAQGYYFSDQPNQAIEAYRKAAPLAPDGETYLNLARALLNEGRIAEARQAAQQALTKGVKHPGDAKKILGVGKK